MERTITLIALFAALIAVLGLLPKLALASGVPITAQSLGVMLCGTILGARRGALAVGLFLLLVALGLPLLAGGRGGLGVFASPSAGFILGFPVAAAVTGWIMERNPLKSLLSGAVLASVVGCIVVLYMAGTLGLAIVLDKTLVQAAALSLPYLPGDVIKAFLAGFITQSLWKARPDLILSLSPSRK